MLCALIVIVIVPVFMVVFGTSIVLVMMVVVWLLSWPMMVGVTLVCHGGRRSLLERNPLQPLSFKFI